MDHWGEVRKNGIKFKIVLPILKNISFKTGRLLCNNLRQTSQKPTKFYDELEIAKRIDLIEAIKIYLNMTSKVYLDKTNNFKLKVSSIRQIENIIKFIQKAPIKLLGYKKLQYLLFIKELRKIPRYSNKFQIPNKYIN